MSYQVTSIRKRPKTLRSLIGQDFLVSALSTSLIQEHLAQAYLFSGPHGVGKTSAARALARAVNCLEVDRKKRPCGTCSSCLALDAGNHLDVIEIDGASHTGVGDIRDIREEILFTPQMGHSKVYIIDEVHMLSQAAFNALLKTIEEPPPHVIFIFATTELHKVPLTVKSRCQHFHFNRISTMSIVELLRTLCEELTCSFEEGALFWIAKEANGSLRDAYTLFDQIVALTEGNLHLSLIEEKLGLLSLETNKRFMSAFAQGQRSEVFHLLEELLSRGISLSQIAEELLSFFRALLLIRQGVHSLDVLGRALDDFQVEAPWSIEQLEQAVRLLLGTLSRMGQSVEPRFEFELTLSQLCALHSFLSAEMLYDKLEELASMQEPMETEENPSEEKVYDLQKQDSLHSEGNDLEISRQDILTEVHQLFLPISSLSPLLEERLSIDYEKKHLHLRLSASYELEQFQRHQITQRFRERHPSWTFDASVSLQNEGELRLDAVDFSLKEDRATIDTMKNVLGARYVGEHDFLSADEEENQYGI